MSAGKVCWLCNATKGNTEDGSDAHLCFTDVSEGAGFWATYMSSVPWTSEPPYARLEGFSPDMIVPDLLHVLNLGVGRHLVGSILKVVLKQRVVWTQGTVEERMNAASCSLQAFARAGGHHMRLKRITKQRMLWKADTYPEMCSSGHDNYVLCSWLRTVLEPHVNIYKDYCAMLWTLGEAMSLIYHGPRFLSQPVLDQIRSLGNAFLKLYMRHATMAKDAHEFLFRVQPKLHSLDHIFKSRRCVNARFYSTWMDEDFLKRMSRPMELVDVNTGQKRALQRWLLGLHEILNKRLQGRES